MREKLHELHQEESELNNKVGLYATTMPAQKSKLKKVLEKEILELHTTLSKMHKNSKGKKGKHKKSKKHNA